MRESGERERQREDAALVGECSACAGGRRIKSGGMIIGLEHHICGYDVLAQGKRMAQSEQLAKLREGVPIWNKWRQEHPDVAIDLAGAHLAKADLRGVQLPGAGLAQAILDGADLSGADLTGAHLAAAFLTRADLTGASLSLADLRWASLSEAILSAARVERADFLEADLRATLFIRASLREASFRNADMTGANLTEADIRSANLAGTNLSGTYLSNADFDGAFMSGTVFGDSDLRAARGLETVQHIGPSVIGVDTIFRSKGKIPEAFLRGCGVPDALVAYMSSFVGNPIEFYSCFISYSTKDQAFAERLHADLQNKGVRCWFAPQDVQAGRKLHEQIDEAIRLHDKLLLILSTHGMESDWVNTEIANARQREIRDKRRVLFPIRLVSFETVRDWACFDADTGKDSAREIREYFIPDFSHWKDHDSYQGAFNRLIADLRVLDSKPLA
jgi:uncharacterized protein YjbI with pentapeptide repeats